MDFGIKYLLNISLLTLWIPRGLLTVLLFEISTRFGLGGGLREDARFTPHVGVARVIQVRVLHALAVICSKRAPSLCGDIVSRLAQLLGLDLIGVNWVHG